jgi:hypothetical protein
MIEARCIGEPISWPRLEQHARVRDAVVDTHVATCPACRACLDAVVGDRVALPGLPAIAAPVARRTRWWWLAAPALAAAAVVVVLATRPRAIGPTSGSHGTLVARVKGVGDVVVGVQRERAGVVRDDVRTFAPGDRWHVVVTCPPDARGAVTVELEVRDGLTVDHPLAPAELACGNDIVVPGAFALTGTRANDVCVRVHAAGGDGAGEACVTIAPE